MVKVFLNQIQSAAGLTLFTTDNSGEPQYFAANTASRVVAVNASGNAFELKSYANWDTAFSWGNHASVGYLTTETDPTVPSHVKAITVTDIANWNTAYSWGNHASAGYLTTAAAATTYVPYTGASANVNLGEYGIAGGFFSFDTTPTTYSAAVGRLGWNDTDGTIELTLKGGNVISKIGENLFVRVYNNTVSNIARGKVVYITGSSGQRLTIDLADADTEATSKNTFGITAEAINVNSEGFVLVSGTLNSLNTSGFLDGETMFLSSTAGSYTNTAPSHPAHTVIVGFVVKGGSTGAGSIYIKVNNGYEIDELHNVLISSVQPNDILYYDSATQLWKNASIVSKIAANTLSLSQLPQIATSSFLGRVTAGTGNVEVLTGTQATSLLDLFSTTTTTKGLVPGSNSLGNTYFLRADGTWAVPAGGGGGSGTVTSVDLSMPTGFTVSNNPVTTSGTLTVAFASGYSLPTNTSQTNWDTAYSWGNHASAGYLTSIATNSITDSMLRQSAALSVIGRATNTAGNVADIVAGNDYEILRRNGTSIGFGSIDLSQSLAVGTSRLQYSNLAQGVALSVLGVAGNLANDVASINAASDFHVLRRSGSTLGFGTLNAAAMNSTYIAGQYLTTDVSGNLSWATVSGGGLLYFTENRNTTTPNATIPAHQFIASGAESAIDAVFSPKGSGAILAQIPDNTTTGGNKRGSYAIDLQMQRTNANQVASAARCFIGGGQRNIVTDTESGTIAGYGNSIASPYSVAGGFSNTISAGGGSSALFGESNSVGASHAAAFGAGSTNTVNGYSAVFGRLNNASQTYVFVSGYQALANFYGVRLHGHGQISRKGDNQRGDIAMWRSITGTAQTDLFLDGSSAKPTMQSNGVWNFTVSVVAVTSVVGNGTGTLGDSYAITLSGCIKRIGNTTALVGSIQTIMAAQADTGINSSVVTVTADDTNECLRIQFTPPTTAGSTTVTRVNARVDFTEIGY